MQRLLTDLAREGTTESSGSFSLDPALAVRKLALFQKAEPAQFCALLVQAAVLSGAEAVRFRFGGGGVVATWTPDPAHGALEQWRTLPELLQEAGPRALITPLDHLVAALHAGLALDPLAVGWSFVGPEASWAVMVGEEGLLVQDGPGAEPELRFALRLRLEGSFFQRLKRRFTGHADWLQRLATRCGSCPVPLYADGRLLNWPLRGPTWSTLCSKFGGVENLRAERLVLGGEPRRGLLLGPPPATRHATFLDFGSGPRKVKGKLLMSNYFTTGLMELRGPGQVVETGEEEGLVLGRPRRSEPDPEHDTWWTEWDPCGVTLRQMGAGWVTRVSYPEAVDPGFRVYGFDPTLCRAVFSLPVDGQGSGQLTVVRWGVALDPVAVDLGSPGAIAVVAHDCAIDLSRLRPLQDERFAHLVEDCRAQIAELEAGLAALSGAARP